MCSHCLIFQGGRILAALCKQLCVSGRRSLADSSRILHSGKKTPISRLPWQGMVTHPWIPTVIEKTALSSRLA